MSEKQEKPPQWAIDAAREIAFWTVGGDRSMEPNPTEIVEIASIIARSVPAGAERERGETQWQPIETAPKDGEEVLLWIPDEDGMELAHWREDAGAWDTYSAGWLKANPSHWTRPAAPSPAPAAELSPVTDEMDAEIEARTRAAADAPAPPKTITVDYELWLTCAGISQRNVDLAACLTRILRDLPTRRDWLDPEVERWAQRLTTSAAAQAGE